MPREARKSRTGSAAVVVVLVLGLLAAPLAVEAQQAGRVWRVGMELTYRAPRPLMLTAQLAWCGDWLGIRAYSGTPD